MNARSGRDEKSSALPFARKSGNYGARLARNQRTRRVIPRRQRLLKIGIDPAIGKVTQIEGTGSDSTDVTNPRQDCVHHRPLMGADLRTVSKAR